MPIPGSVPTTTPAHRALVPLLAAALTALGASLATATASAQGLPEGTATDAAGAAGFVVVLRGDEDADATTGRLERAGGFVAHQRYSSAVRGFAAHLSAAQVARVRSDTKVAAVVPDIPFHGDGVPVAARETVPPGIRRIRAATTAEVGAAARRSVAVIDTGLDLTHPDLNALSGVNCIKPGAAAQDDNGHGTHVAGTLAGRNSGSGVVGVAPGTKLYAVKVLDARSRGTLSSILCGVDWVTKNAATLGIRVANMSVGASGRDDGACGAIDGNVLHTAICRSSAARVVYVASAGNNGSDFSAQAPASFPEVLTVAGLTDTDGMPGGKGKACAKTEVDDKVRSSSNFAVTAAQAAHLVAAPASCVLSAKRGGGTTTMSGTSMAAPHAAGAIALCLGSEEAPGPCSGLEPPAIIAKMHAAAELAGLAGWGYLGDPLRPLTGRIYGHAVSAALS